MQHNQVVHNTIQGKYPGNRLRKREKESVLYHYTSFNSFKAIWESKKFRLGAVKKVNDIYEKNIARCIRSECWDNDNIMLEYLKFRNEFKQASFTMDYNSYIKGCQSPTMWAHYGDESKRDENDISENGVCIQIDPMKIKNIGECMKGSISYISQIPASPIIDETITTKGAVLSFIEKNKKEIFFTKHKDWKYENEYRIVSNTCSELDFSNAITCVYVTHCMSKTSQQLQKLIDDSIPIKVIDFINNGKYQIPVIVDLKFAQEQFKNRCKLYSDMETSKA